jgi:hypothetical protein
VATQTTGLPSGGRLAARYSRDRGIGDDPAVLLLKDFEQGDFADTAKRWDRCEQQGRAGASADL